MYIFIHIHFYQHFQNSLIPEYTVTIVIMIKITFLVNVSFIPHSSFSLARASRAVTVSGITNKRYTIRLRVNVFHPNVILRGWGSQNMIKTVRTFLYKSSKLLAKLLLAQKSHSREYRVIHFAWSWHMYVWCTNARALGQFLEPLWIIIPRAWDA